MFRKIIAVNVIVFFFYLSPADAQIKMGLAESYSNSMDVSGVTAEYLYKRSWENALDLLHPEAGRVSVTNCHETLSLLEEGYTPSGFLEHGKIPLGAIERGRINACYLLKDVASMQPYENNYLNEDAGFVSSGRGLTSSFPDYAPSFIANINHPGRAILEEGRTWREVDDIVNVDEMMRSTDSPYRITVYTDDGFYWARNVLYLEHLGDYNDDGYADAVISYSITYKYDPNPRNPPNLNASLYYSSGHFIISKTDGQGDRMSVIKWYRSSIVDGRNIHDLENSYAEGDASLRRDLNFIRMLLDEIPLEYNTSRVTPYNNIAYYLEQSGHYDSAIYLLEEIVKHFPARTVAYINLGDAYWGLEKYSEAREAYQNYIRLMRESNREQRIPQRVFDRMSD